MSSFSYYTYNVHGTVPNLFCSRHKFVKLSLDLRKSHNDSNWIAFHTDFLDALDSNTALTSLDLRVVTQHHCRNCSLLFSEDSASIASYHSSINYSS